MRYAYRPDLVVDSIGDLCDDGIYQQAIGATNHFAPLLAAGGNGSPTAPAPLLRG